MAFTAAAMYGAAGLDGVVEGFLPGDPKSSPWPVVVVAVILGGLLTLGPRMPRWALALLGPLGVALIAYALATTSGAGDGAVLYALPVVWTTLFWGRRGAIAILACVGVGHAAALSALPAASSYPGRWVDVMVSACSIAVVILALEQRNAQLVARLAGEARTDSLTGLLNRRGFHERASIELAHAKREGTRIAVAAFDVDSFKRINDNWGHDVGDRVLAHIGQLLSAECREIDVAARLGGDEFTVLLPGGDSDDACAFTERIRLALQSSFSGLPAIGISAGVFACGSPATIDQLLQRADSALYESKRSGRNRTSVGSVDKIGSRPIGKTAPNPN
jgi:diguanylate cyclase (GGDEF)-like protein